jgi:hypothetical protein
MKKLLIVGTLAAQFALGGCSASPDAQPSATVTVTVTAKPTEPPELEGSATDSNYGPWTDGRLHIVDGRWLVGDDANIPSRGNLITPYGVGDCRWAVFDDQGILIEKVKVRSEASQSIRGLQDGDIVESSGCTVWMVYVSDPTETPLSYEGSGEFKDRGEPVFGTHVVGDTIPAGEYWQETKGGATGPCEYSIKEKRVGRYWDVADFSSTNLGARSSTDEVITLENGNLFESDGCGVWQRKVYVRK